MVCQIYANVRHVALVSFSSSLLPLCLLCVGLMSLSCLACASESLYLLPVNLLSGILPMLVLASSFLPKNKSLIFLMLIVQILFNGLYLCGVYWFGVRIPPKVFGFSALVISMFYVMYCLVSLWLYIRRVRNVVQKTTVWTMLSLSVDAVYVFFMVGTSMVFFLGCIHAGRASPQHSYHRS